MPPESIRQRFQKTTVADVEAGMAIPPTVLPVDASLREIAEAIVRIPASRVVAVVNEEDRLVGMIPLRSVAFRVLAKVMPERALHLASNLEQADTFAPLSSAETARQMMDPPASLRGTTTIGEALERILALGVGGLPIVDESERVVGYCDLAEILDAWLRLLDSGATT